ncbi:MAG TPA: aminotransferase class I/II-fold pyridoxal phosphate-dependent enzyme [Gemmatimonadales bacterium]|jgi:LL-diaminopimelate aminotransferase|nr:aminotransferase class I/II-fold pyridoxal phosphate-dependent enzyme [Gemmatimonadales bacterium]
MIQPNARVNALPGYPLAEIPSIKRRLLDQGVDVIDLGAGDADLKPPQPIIDALIAAQGELKYHKYGFQQGLPEFRQAVSRFMQTRFGQDFDPATEVLPLIGSKEGLTHLAFGVAGPGDVVLVPEPGYQAYIGGALLSGAEPLICGLKAEKQFLLDWDAIPEATLRKTKLVYLNYPNNPTSAVAPMEYLERTVAICRKYGILLAYDNPYVDVTFDGYRAPSIFEVPGAREVAVEFLSLSKSYSMTGWRCGFAVGRKELIYILNRVKSYTDTGPWLAVQHAGIVALDRSEEFVRPFVAELQARRDAALGVLRRDGFDVATPKGAMYLWVPLPAGVPSAPFTRRVLEESGVVLLPGSGFGPAGEGFFRIALTLPAPRIAEGIARVGAMLAKVQGEGVVARA